MQQLKNSYWFSHAALQSNARVYYGDAYNLPAALGEFDIAVMGAVLLHCRDPLGSSSNAENERSRSSLSTNSIRTWKPPVCRLADAGEFPLAHVVAFQHTILYTVFGGNGIHDLGAGDTPAVSPRTCAHAFHSRRSTRMTRSQDAEERTERTVQIKLL
jgi:hypothetical protein